MADLTLPKSKIKAIAKGALPKDLLLAGDTQNVLVASCSEFIQMLTAEANELADKQKKNTISSQHIYKALETLGYGNFAEDLKASLSEYKATVASKPKMKKKPLDQSDADEQQALFAAARARMQAKLQASQGQ
mmetsp:Transcript_5844/g.6352  ORF Transcript_5844/g.6352 Transcript_5844/m.6352 type:complete len:133 (+) Transcript_5844:94-492(+)